jgi:Family of unknown function (DUF5709)
MTGRDDSDDLDDTAQLDESDTLDGFGDPLDTGYSPPERPWVVDGRAAEHEDLAHRLARELPDVGSEDNDDGEGGGAAGDGIGDSIGTDGEAWDDQVGDRRAGRLVAAGEGGARDDDPDAWASDIGIDGSGASAEEAAVHVVDPDR